MASQVEMPSSLFSDLGGGGGLVEDQRAFQLALELSMLSLGETLPATTSLASPLGFAPPPEDRAKKSQNMTECVPVPSSEHVAEIVGRQGTAARSIRRRLLSRRRSPPQPARPRRTAVEVIRCHGRRRGWTAPPLCKGARATSRFEVMFDHNQHPVTGSRANTRRPAKNSQCFCFVYPHSIC